MPLRDWLAAAGGLGVINGDGSGWVVPGSEGFDIVNACPVCFELFVQCFELAVL